MKFVNCCVCDSRDFKKIYTITKNNDSFDIVKCRSCGHIYQNPRLNENEIKKSYDKKKKFYRSLPRETNKEAFDLIFNKRLENIEKFIGKGRILDIGCAFGMFVSVAKKRGWHAFGIEIAGHMAKFAKKELGLNVCFGTLEQAKFRKNFFDAITMFDVIEHVSEPKKLLEECNRILKRNGLLVIQTPAIDSMYSRIKGRKWDYYGLQHLNYFSLKSMRNILKKTGFRIVKIYHGDEIGFMTAMRAYIQNRENKRDIQSIAKIGLKQILRRIHVKNIDFGSRVYYAVKC